MSVTLLRGKDSYRRQQFWKGLSKQGFERSPFKGVYSDLINILNTPHLFGNCVYVIEDQKLINDITDYLIHNSIHHPLVIDQKDRSEPCYRRLSRKFEVITCDPIWAYKQEDVINWIYEICKGMEISVTYPEAKLLLDNLGEESLEIVRVLELHKLSGADIITLVEFDTSKAMLEVIDSVARHNHDRAVKSLIFLQQQGIEFSQVASAILTRYELLLKIKCSRMLRASDEDVKKNLHLSRMIAGNVLTEANMNNFAWCFKLMKNLINNFYSPVGYEWFIITLMSL